MQKWAQSCVAVSVLLSGCAVFDKTPQESNPDTKQVTLRIPSGMAVPNQPSAYDIPALKQQGASANAAAESPRSPTLILATAGSSRIDEDEKLARVWFERNDNTGDLLPFIQAQLQTFFDSQNVTLTPTDDSGLRYETNWVKRSKSSGFWFWKSEDAVDQVRYAIELAPRPHGRTLSMTVTLLEHQYFVPEAELAAADVKATEVNLLNRVINQVAIAETQKARELRARVAEVALEPGMDAAGNPALVTTQSLDVTWSQLELLFGELNLNVTDFDRSVYTYYVNYVKPERGFWRAVTFRDAPAGLPLENGDYQLVLTRQGDNGTAITWLDKDGQPLNATDVTALYEPFVQVIRAVGAEL